MAKIYKADGSMVEVEPKNGKDFGLKEMQAIVGGYIEIIDLLDGTFMVLNEEGKLIGLPYNNMATIMFRKAHHTFDYVVGDVLVCDKSQID